MSTNIVVAIEARIYREGLAAALNARGNFSVVAAESTTMGALDAVASLQPQVVLVDVGMGGASALARSLTVRQPEVVMIAIAVNGDDAELMSWAEAGAAGFITRENSIDDLAECIEAAMRHELVCSPHMSAILLRRLASLAAERPSERAGASTPLTPRQAQVLQRVQRGMTNKQIAREMGIELATVKNHVHQVLQRLNVRRRRDIAVSLTPLLIGQRRAAGMARPR
jgi:DNA-binding NarL/FixJ family response regulator